MKILFIEPKAPGMHVFSIVQLPRLGPVLLATILCGEGHDATVLVEEATAIDWNRMTDYDLVGISSITSTAPRAYEIADRVRALGVPVVLGGPHPTFMPDEGLEHADWVVRGEADASIRPFVAAVERGEGFSEIPGLSWHRGGEVIHNERGPALKDLDTLPAPNLSLVKKSDARPFAFLATRTLPVQTSRGCPYDCSFCSVTGMFGRRYRFRSAERVIEELKALDYDGAHVFFYDDNFTANPTRAKELLHAMIDAGLKPEWSTQVHIDCARHSGLLPLMRRAGCETVYIGFESINPQTLRLYDKAQSVDAMERAINSVHEAGMRVHGMFVFGSDADDAATIRATARWAEAQKIDTVQFLILTPLPGTRVFDDFNREGRLIEKDWAQYDTHHVVFKPAKMSAFTLQMETLRAQGRFYRMRQVLRSLFGGQKFTTFNRLYARQHNRTWLKTHKVFLKKLLESDFATGASATDGKGVATAWVHGEV